MVENCGLVSMEIVKIFEYKKNNDKYQDWAKLHHQVINKALLITKILYLGYFFLFFFDNVTNHSIYIKNALQVKDMNKDIGGKQPILHNDYYNLNSIRII